MAKEVSGSIQNPCQKYSFLCQTSRNEHGKCRHPCNVPNLEDNQPFHALAVFLTIFVPVLATLCLPGGVLVLHQASSIMQKLGFWSAACPRNLQTIHAQQRYRTSADYIPCVSLASLTVSEFKRRIFFCLRLPFAFQNGLLHST